MFLGLMVHFGFMVGLLQLLLVMLGCFLAVLGEFVHNVVLVCIVLVSILRSLSDFLLSLFLFLVLFRPSSFSSQVGIFPSVRI